MSDEWHRGPDQPTTDDPGEHRVEWLLRERLGGETPPDLQAAVLARLRAAPAPRRGRLLAAALVLLGGSVVAVNFALSRHAERRPTSPQPPRLQDPLPVDPVELTPVFAWSAPPEVRSSADIEALPADTRQVYGIDLDDDDLLALLRLRHLEGLALSASWRFEVPHHGTRITDAGLEHLVALPSLRALALERQVEVGGDGLLRVARNSTLRELTCMEMAVSNALLAGLAERPFVAVRLMACQGFDGRGLASLTRCPSLRHVSLHGCTQLQDTWIGELAAAAQLESLDLSAIGSHTMFSGVRRSPLPEEPPGSGVTDRLLELLAPMRGVRKLVLHTGSITDSGLASLSEWRQLRELDLGGIEISAAGIAHLPPGLRRLSLLGNSALDAELLAAVLAREHLREVDISWCAGMPEDVIDRLCAAGHLQSLDVSGWQLSDAQKQRLRALPFLVRFSPDETNR